VGAGLALFTEEVGDLPAQPRDLGPELGASPDSLRFSAWAVSSLRSSEVSEARWLAGIGALVDLPVVASRSCRICRQMSGWE